MLEAMPRIDGEKLRKIRDERLLSQRELAEKANLSPTTILKLEANRVAQPHPRTVRRLVEALGAEPHEILKGGDDG
jgi:transcriptional regulator with XRE-family HTH domain